MASGALSHHKRLRDRFEDFVKGPGFSGVCFVLWSAMALSRVFALLRAPSVVGGVWLCYSVVLAVLFLVRTRPRAVSLEPLHWLVALGSVFSLMLFDSGAPALPGMGRLAEVMMAAGLIGSGSAALALRRNYDFLPALREVTTDWLYGIVRHPMYAFSMLLNAGYVVGHASLHNAAVLAAMIVLYELRSRYEERTMALDAGYRDYMARVRWRFVPELV